jgi:hypothetical protein
MSVPFGGAAAHVGDIELTDERSSASGRDDLEALKRFVVSRARDAGRLLTVRRRVSAEERAARTVVLPAREGEEALELDLKSLTKEEHAALVDRAAPHDSEAFFSRLRARFDRAGVKLASVEVRARRC